MEVHPLFWVNHPLGVLPFSAGGVKLDLWMPAPFWAETQRGNVSLATVEKCFISWKDRVRQGVVSWLEDLSPLIGSITQGLLTGHYSIIKQSRQKWKFWKNYLSIFWLICNFKRFLVLHLNKLFKNSLDLQKNWKDSAEVHIHPISFIVRNKGIYYSTPRSMNICIFVSYFHNEGFFLNSEHFNKKIKNKNWSVVENFKKYHFLSSATPSM